ncbi:MAG: DUF5615 family PIN-like protein [bacterium]
MKFLVDAHLPRRLAYRLRDLGYDTIHTRDLPLENRTPDSVIEEISLREKRVVVTKDADFVNSFTLHGKPYKLLLVSTGNIKNIDLEKLFLQNIDEIVKAFKKYSFIEIDRSIITFHE